MTLIFDTSVLILLEKGIPETIEKLRIIGESEKGSISFISYFEFIYGISKKSMKNMNNSHSFIQNFTFLTPTKNTAKIMVDLRKRYESQGVIFSLPDLMIASQAIENGLILLTSDKQFLKIKELRKEII